MENIQKVCMRSFQCKSTESTSPTHTSCADVFHRRVCGTKPEELAPWDTPWLGSAESFPAHCPCLIWHKLVLAFVCLSAVAMNPLPSLLKPTPKATCPRRPCPRGTTLQAVPITHQPLLVSSCHLQAHLACRKCTPTATQHQQASVQTEASEQTVSQTHRFSKQCALADPTQNPLPKKDDNMSLPSKLFANTSFLFLFLQGAPFLFFASFLLPPT